MCAVWYVAAFIVGMPAVYVLARLLPEVSGHGPALPVPPGWTADAEPSLWIAGVLIGVLLVVTDVLVLDGHVGGFRNVFKERAAYLACFVWAQKRYGLVVYV